MCACVHMHVHVSDYAAGKNCKDDMMGEQAEVRVCALRVLLT